MKFPFYLFLLISVSCFSCGEAVGYLKYPVPEGNQLLFIPTASHIFSDQSPMEKEIVLSIGEELERIGYQVIPNEDIHTHNLLTSIPKDHLERLEFEFAPRPYAFEPKLKHWIRIAKEKGISELILIRFVKPVPKNSIPIRLHWIHITENEMERFDWNWEEKKPFPFLKTREKANR